MDLPGASALEKVDAGGRDSADQDHDVGQERQSLTLCCKRLTSKLRSRSFQVVNSSKCGCHAAIQGENASLWMLFVRDKVIWQAKSYNQDPAPRRNVYRRRSRGERSRNTA